MKLSKATPAPRGSSKLNNNVDIATSVFETGQKLVTAGREYWRKHFSYTITIAEKDPLYGEVLDWLTAISPEEKHRTLTVSTSKHGRGNLWSADESDPQSEKVSPLIVRFDQGTQKSVTIGGHRVSVSVVVPEMTPETKMSSGYIDSKIIFIMQSHAAQKAVLKMLGEVNNSRGKTRKANLKMVNAWNQWVTRSDLPPRTMPSVALPPDQKKRIVDDLRSFLAAEEKYNRLAIPYHRGYMFHGPAGTGKTSLVKALANEFNLDLWYISLSDLKAEASLISLLAEVGPRSLLLLEDIDTIQITHDRDSAEQGSISMSSLLNTLDGVATPHGMIAVMTTNRFEVLDSALTRAGRMDMIEHLDYPTVNTLSDMFLHFYGKRPSWKFTERDIPIEGLSTSQVAEVMKRHLDDPRLASKHIVGMIYGIVK